MKYKLCYFLSVVLLFPALGANAAKPQRAKASQVSKPKSRAIMRIFDGSGTRLIEMVEAQSFLIQSDGPLPKLGITANRGGISLQGSVIADPGPKQQSFGGGERAIFKFENASVALNLRGGLPPDFATLLETDWKGINRFSWGTSSVVGQLSMNDSLVFDLASKTLTKSVESGTWTRRHSFQLRFLGITPAMLEACTKEPSPRENDYSGDWGRELYLPKYGANVIEVLQSSDGDFDLASTWTEKVKVVWRCPRPKSLSDPKPLPTEKRALKKTSPSKRNAS